VSSNVDSAAAPAEEEAGEAAGEDESSSSDVISDEDDADLPDDPADEDFSDGSAVSKNSDSEGEGAAEKRGSRVNTAKISAPGVLCVRVVSLCNAKPYAEQVWPRPGINSPAR
jgi:hypothetical protein